MRPPPLRPVRSAGRPKNSVVSISILMYIGFGIGQEISCIQSSAQENNPVPDPSIGGDYRLDTARHSANHIVSVAGISGKKSACRRQANSPSGCRRWSGAITIIRCAGHRQPSAVQVYLVKGGECMIYFIDPSTVVKRKCPSYCGLVVRPLYGIVVWPLP